MLITFFGFYLLIGIFTSKPILTNSLSNSRAFYDESGALLRLTLSSDEKYRLITPISNIQKNLIATTLAQEDKYYYYHIGVNPFSLIRAFYYTYITKSRRIGGSTISMQLARMRFGINSRTIIGKLHQIWLAIVLERHFTKHEILEAYFNTAPYGANIEGVAAASIIYFNKDVSRLSLPECIMLSVLPQSPTARTPHTRSGKKQLNDAARQLFNKMGQKSTERELLQVHMNSRRELPFLAPHFVERMLNMSTTDMTDSTKTTLDLALQKTIEATVSNYMETARHLGVSNATAMVIDYRTMYVKAYVGSADYLNIDIDGNVNGLNAQRSPGSALKPFVYALALDQGLINSETTLKDVDFNISEFNPENFDKQFLGVVSATEALTLSRNIPAVLLANKLSNPSFYSLLKQAKIKNLKAPDFYGLAAVLGGIEVSMEEVVKLYAMLANGGKFQELVFIAPPHNNNHNSKNKNYQQLLSPEASFIVLDMLASNPRVGQEYSALNTTQRYNIPWKTGTSWGFRDAWAISVVGKYVIGVWIGNFDGHPNANFIGRDIAGPLMFNIADAITHEQFSSLRFLTEFWKPQEIQALNLKKVKVCATSGALLGEHCDKHKEAWFIPGKSSIETCQVHRSVHIDITDGQRICSSTLENTNPKNANNIREEVFEFWPSDVELYFKTHGFERKLAPNFKPECKEEERGKEHAPKINSPQQALTYIMRHDAPIQIPLNAITDGEAKKVFWFIDNTFIAETKSGETYHWTGTLGKHQLSASSEYGDVTTQELRVSLAPK